MALKAVAEGLLHKSDAGGVLLGLEDADAVRAGARRDRRAVAAAGHRLEGLVVQPMAPAGVELLWAWSTTASFGPVIACGAGRRDARAAGDVAVRITPLTDLDAARCCARCAPSRCSRATAARRGATSRRWKTVLLRLSALVEGRPEIVELDANPVVVGPAGAAIVDARVRLAKAPSPRPLSAI